MAAALGRLAGPAALPLSPACAAQPAQRQPPGAHRPADRPAKCRGAAAKSSSSSSSATGAASGGGAACRAAAGGALDASASAALQPKQPTASSAEGSSSSAAAQEPAGAGQRGTQPHASSSAPAPTAAGVPGSCGVPREQLPSHVALIMDGNSRWAAARGLPAAAGYQRGVERLKEAVESCRAWGIPCLTVYAFSQENWRRPAHEVDALLALMERTLRAEVAELARRGVRLRCIGQHAQLPASLRDAMAAAEAATAGGAALHLTVALSYSGRQDVTAAAAELVRQAFEGRLTPADVTPELLASQLATRGLPSGWRDPDLVIRTSGERRLSNFLCWEAAYAELYFSPTHWPDFGAPQLAAALQDYAGRERRFGGRHPGGGGGGGGG